MTAYSADPKVSVVTVCRNALQALQLTAASVRAQRYGDMEYIVVDGGSTDGTREYLESTGIADTYVSEPDGGIYDAMNKGVRLARGEWVIFMNAADSFAGPEALAGAMKAADAEADVVYGSVIRQQNDGSERLVEAGEARSGHRMFYCHQSALVRREWLLRFPFDTRHALSADFKQVKQMLAAGARFRRTDIPVARFDTGGISTRRRSEGLADNMRVVAETDGLLRGLPHILHLLPTYLLCRLRGR